MFLLLFTEKKSIANQKYMFVWQLLAWWSKHSNQHSISRGMGDGGIKSHSCSHPNRGLSENRPAKKPTFGQTKSHIADKYIDTYNMYMQLFSPSYTYIPSYSQGCYSYILLDQSIRFGQVSSLMVGEHRSGHISHIFVPLHPCDGYFYPHFSLVRWYMMILYAYGVYFSHHCSDLPPTSSTAPSAVADVSK